MTLDIANFSLMTPMTDYKQLRMNLSTTPEEIIKECNLHKVSHNSQAHAEIRKGAHGLPQSGILVYELLENRLTKAGHYQKPTTPGLWQHKSRPIMFSLVVDDVGVEYVGKENVECLKNTRITL